MDTLYSCKTYIVLHFPLVILLAESFVCLSIVLLKFDIIILWKTGGQLNRIRTSLRYLCPAEHIPSKIEVDVSKLDIGERIFIRDVDVHPSLKLLSKNEVMPICKIVATNTESAEPS